jgi:peptidoglycan/LPS O-acetylase OafA/YrhL
MRHIFGLDIIRFLAAILVLLNHFATYSATSPSLAAIPNDRAFAFLSVFEGVGATGVQIFFVISGFVIAMSAQGLSGLSGALRFALARALRILPALWISGLISVVALWLVGDNPISLLDRFLRSAVLSPIGPYIDGVVWSLVVEAVFYTLIAGLILKGPRIPLRLVALCLGGISCLYISGCILMAVIDNTAWISVLDRFPFKVFLLRHGVFFAMGMLIFDRIARQRAGLVDDISVLSTSAIILFCGFGFGEVWLGMRGLGPTATVAAIITYLAGLIALQLSIRIHAAPALPVLYRYLGSMSYTIYLNHYTTGMVIVYILAKTSLSGAALFIASLLAVLFVSHTVLLLETYLRALAKPFLGIHPHQRTPAE